MQESPEDQGFLSRISEPHRLVSIARGSADVACNTPVVGVNNRLGALLALEHLAGLGHRRIGCISAGRMGDLHERVGTYREFMTERFGGAPEAYIELDRNSYEGGYAAARRLLSLSPSVRPDGAVSPRTIGWRSGRLPPLWIWGCGCRRMCPSSGSTTWRAPRYCRPALTTVRQPMEAIGRKAMELILAMIEGGQEIEPCPRIQLEPELVVPRVVRGRARAGHFLRD